MGFLDDMKNKAGAMSDGLKKQVEQFVNAEFAAAAMATCAMVAATDGTIDAAERKRVAEFIMSSNLLKSFDVADLNSKFNYYCNKLQADYDFGRIEAIQVIGKLKNKPEQARAVLQVGIVISGYDRTFDDKKKAALLELCHAVGIDSKELVVVENLPQSFAMQEKTESQINQEKSQAVLMSTINTMDELQSPNHKDEPPIIDSPLQFKAKLNIGEEAYAYLSKADNFMDFSIKIAAGLGGSSLFTVAWLASLGPVAQLALSVGFISTPVGWIAGAGALSMVLAYGLMKAKGKSKDATTITIPKHLNTPLDLLGQTVLSLILPVTVKMALADGHFCENERKVLRDYLAHEWGFNRYFIDKAITEQESLIADFDYDHYRQLLIASTCADKEMKFDVIKVELLTILTEVMKADEHISPEEEKELEKLSIIINEQGEAEARSVAETVIGSINKTKQSITDFISTKVVSVKKSIPDVTSAADISNDLLFDRLRQLDEKNIRSLIVSGLRVSKGNLKDLGEEDLILMCSKELRSAAGSSCRNFFRSGHEFPYKQILIDVADRLADGFTPLSWTKYKLDDSHSENEIEDTILKVFNERTRKWWDKLPDKKKAEFVDGIQSVLAGEELEKVNLAGGVKTVITQQVIDNAIQCGVMFGLSKFLAPGLAGMLGVSIVGHIGWLIIVQTLGFMTGIKIAIFGIAGLGGWGGAVSFLGATAVGGVLSIPSTLLVLDGVAYRKTIPTVIMLLAMCRQKQILPDSLTASDEQNQFEGASVINNHFVGRGDAVQQLRDVLSGKKASGGKLTVQSIEGPGGIGKTSLLEHAIDGIDLSSRNYLTLKVDGNASNALTLTEVIWRLVNSVAIQRRLPGDSFPGTIKILSLINEIRSATVHEAISLITENDNNIDIDESTKRINNALEMSIRTGVSILAYTSGNPVAIALCPFIDIIPLDKLKKIPSLCIEKTGIKEKLGITSNEAIRNAIRENACRTLASSLYSELAAILFKYEALLKPSRSKIKGIDRLLLIIDDYEKLQEPLSTFLVNYFLPSLKKAEFESVVIILGRDHLQATNTEWEQYLKANMLKKIEVTPLARPDMDQLVESYGVLTQAEKERAWNDTQGYPYYVQLWIDEIAEGVHPGATMLKQFYDRITQGMNEQQKEWLQYTLFLDRVNKRTLREIIGDEAQAEAVLKWFKCEGSVRDPKGASFCVREYIRSRLKDYLRISDPDRYSELQRKGREVMNDEAVQEKQ